jgi:hypothetical protein
VHDWLLGPEHVKPEPDGYGLLHVRDCVQADEQNPNALQPPLTATTAPAQTG